MIEIKVDDARVTAALERLARAATNPAPALKAIGESLVDSTKQRFATSTAPDGSRWAPNSQTTYEAMVNRFSKGSFRKDGRLNAKGSANVAGKKPLIGETGLLASTIFYGVEDSAVRWGSPMIYAAMQNFGGKKSDFPNLWGDIPGRQFMGVSDSDAVMVEQTVEDYLKSAIA